MRWYHVLWRGLILLAVGGVYLIVLAEYWDRGIGDIPLKTYIACSIGGWIAVHVLNGRQKSDESGDASHDHAA